MSERRVILHMGLAKTGTTALQHAFVLTRDHLASRGVRYPECTNDSRVARGLVVSGNGRELVYPFLSSEAHDNSETAHAAALATIGATPGDVLYSNEGLIRFQHERLRDFALEVTGLGARLHAAVFVRDLPGHLWAAYLEFVKRRGYARTFSEFLRERLPHFSARFAQLRVLVDILGQDAVTVMHYDSNRDRISQEFATRVLGPGIELEMPPGVVNRSLTGRELRILRRVNRGADLEHSRQVSDRLLARAPLGEGGSEVSEEDLALLHREFDREVEWVNDQFFPDQRWLRIADTTG